MTIYFIERLFTSAGTAEASIDGLLLKIIDLDKDKIQYLLELVRTEKVRNIIDDQMRHLDHVDEALARELGETFRAWISNLPVIARLPAAAEAEALVPHIRWAAHAKWTYSQHLEAIFCPGEEEVPKWMHKIYKLGRYAVAAKVLLQFARNRPELFTSISIQALEAPQINRFALDWEKSPLKTVIERLTGGGHEEYINQLGKFWLSEAPETKFRKACKLDLTVHAEMQLIAFYDHHPELSLGLPFMGTSKKACFFCNWFLGRHPLGMRISACHQKLYPSWTMAPCTDSRVYNSYTKLIGLLSKYLEETIARDLGTRLGLKRPRVLDSTSGHPSLPGPGSLDLSVRDALPNQEPSGSTLATAAFTNEASDSDQSETFSG
jgi:hypothetical protein